MSNYTRHKIAIDKSIGKVLRAVFVPSCQTRPCFLNKIFGSGLPMTGAERERLVQSNPAGFVVRQE